MVSDGHIACINYSLGPEDELSEALGLAIPSLIKLLGHRCQGVVLDTVSILGRLAKQGE
jgi:hypothetical protein